MTRWKYDAEQNDALRVLRVPVTGRCPSFGYVAAFHKESAHRPTRTEALTIVSLIAFVRSQLPAGECERMDAEPFDIQPLRATHVFHKYQRDDWAYGRSTWSRSFLAVPRSVERMTGPWALVQVMDNIHWDNKKQAVLWAQWKNDHREVFG